VDRMPNAQFMALSYDSVCLHNGAVFGLPKKMWDVYFLSLKRLQWKCGQNWACTGYIVSHSENT
jgi:hypothetical protein